MSLPYPFSALVGQDEMKRAILIAAVGVRLISVQKVTVRIASNGAGVPA